MAEHCCSTNNVVLSTMFFFQQCCSFNNVVQHRRSNNGCSQLSKTGESNSDRTKACSLLSLLLNLVNKLWQYWWLNNAVTTLLSWQNHWMQHNLQQLAYNSANMSLVITVWLFLATTNPHMSKRLAAALKLRLPTLRLIGPISYPGECDFNGSPTKVQRRFLTNAFFLPSYVYNMHQDTKSARSIAQCVNVYLI